MNLRTVRQPHISDMVITTDYHIYFHGIARRHISASDSGIIVRLLADGNYYAAPGYNWFSRWCDAPRNSDALIPLGSYASSQSLDFLTEAIESRASCRLSDYAPYDVHPIGWRCRDLYAYVYKEDNRCPGDPLIEIRRGIGGIRTRSDPIAVPAFQAHARDYNGWVVDGMGSRPSWDGGYFLIPNDDASYLFRLDEGLTALYRMANRDSHPSGVSRRTRDGWVGHDELHSASGP